MRIFKELPKTAVFDEVNSPVGKLKIIASEQGIYSILWEHETVVDLVRDQHYPLILKAKQQLDEYFNGFRQTFDLPLVPIGTEFQMNVWRLLRKR